MRIQRWALLAVVALMALAMACASSSSSAPTATPASGTSGTSASPSGGGGGSVPAGKTFKIGLAQFTTHPALDAARDGVIQALKDGGFENGKNLQLDLQNANGDVATTTTIAQKYKDANVDLIVAVSTPMLQASLTVTKNDKKPPIIFNSVTDPVAAGAGASPGDHVENVTGIQALPPVKDAMATMLRVVPNAKKVGIIWNPAEKNSEVATGIARQAAKDLNLELIEANVNKADEVVTAAQSLVGKGVQAFFISTDSTVVAGLEALVKVAIDSKIPLFSNDPDSAKRGSVTALGLDYYDTGYQSGQMAVKFLKGELKIASTPIEQQKKGSLAVNLKAAEQMGVKLPDAVVNEAPAAQRYNEIKPKT